MVGRDGKQTSPALVEGYKLVFKKIFRGLLAEFTKFIIMPILTQRVCM